MPLDPNRIAIQIVEHMLSNFEWKISKQEITDDEIILTVKRKCIQTESPPEAAAS